MLISHLRADVFVDDTDSFFRRAMDDKTQLVMSDVVYAELYTGIYMASDPESEEARVQGFLGINGIEVRTSRSLKIARRAGQLFSKQLKDGHKARRILPDFLIAAQAEATSQGFVTWNGGDYQGLGLKIPVLSPKEA